MLLKRLCRQLLTVLCLLSLSSSVFAQEAPLVQEAVAPTTQIISGPGTLISPREFLASGKRWEIRLTQRLGVVHQGQAAIERDSLLAIVAEKRQQASSDNPESSISEASSNPIVAEASFEGNDYNGLTPPDNDIAVSNTGQLVSVTNSAIRIMEADGSLLLQADLGDFLDTLGLDGVYFDPRVLFDPSTNKYILVALNGFGPPNSLAIGFSSTSDPMDDWFFYELEGAPDNDDGWLDYPNIGISQQDFFLGGNVFNSTFDFLGVTVFQIAKENGHIGLPLNVLTYSDVLESNGFPDFNLVPISAGYGNLQGQGIYLASTDFFGGETAQVYQITDSVGGNPELLVTEVAIPEFSAPTPGLMAGTFTSITTNDSRLQEGYLADSIIHFVLNSTDPNGDIFTSIYYGQIDLRTMTGDASFYGLNGFEYAFPCIAPMGAVETDGRSVIGYGRTGENIFPEYRVVGVDSNFIWNDDILLRPGDDFVSVVGGIERWGDYTGADRWYAAAEPTVYIVGNFGATDRVLGTWISRIGIGEPTAPTANFLGTPLAITPGESVTFLDQSLNSPQNYFWSFPGGTPDTSNAPFPEIVYEQEGVFDVTLRVSNEEGADTLVRTGYVNVSAGNGPPVTNFVADTTVVTAGDSVTFTDLSTNAPTSWSWTFFGAQPSNSDEQNPTVQYPNPGTYNVFLSTQNEFGNDSEAKLAYITVNPVGFPPQADFSASAVAIEAGNSITFNNLSTNEPTELSWVFEGGNPATADTEAPEITYDLPGIYDVQLTATNEFGSNEKLEVDFITVGVSNTIESELVQRFSLGPNPVMDGAPLKAIFYLPQRSQFDFFIVDANGRVVRQLLRHSVKAGNNELSFSTRYLPNGNYFLVIQQVGLRGALHSSPFTVGG